MSEARAVVKRLPSLRPRAVAKHARVRAGTANRGRGKHDGTFFLAPDAGGARRDRGGASGRGLPSEKTLTGSLIDGSRGHIG